MGGCGLEDLVPDYIYMKTSWWAESRVGCRLAQFFEFLEIEPSSIVSTPEVSLVLGTILIIPLAIVRVFNLNAYINSPIVWVAKLFGYGSLGIIIN